MSLLTQLGLPQLQTSICPMPVMDVTATQGAEVKNAKAQAVPVRGADPAAAAKELRPLLDAKERTAREAYAKLESHQPKLEAAIATATGDDKAALEARKAAVEKHLGLLQKQLKAIDDDRQALDDPRNDAAAFNAILARQKSAVTVDKTIEVDHHDGEFEKKATGKHSTTVTTSYADGKAVTRTEDEKKGIGADGATRSKTTTHDVIQGDNRTTGTVTRTDRVGKEGYTQEKTAKVEREVDGQTSSAEKKRSVKVGPEGASRTDEQKIVNADGSGTNLSRTTAVERGDGKLGAKDQRSRTATDADGNEQKTSTTTKGGLIAGKDGLGAYGEREKAFERKSKGGLTTGAVAGLNANVVCNIKAIDGTPPTYDLSISINLGVSASLSAKKEKEDVGSVGASASGSMAVFMNRHYVLGESEAAAYMASLKAASAGGGGGTQREFAIIGTGVSKSWDAAREMYLAASGKALDPKELAKLKAGESVETGTKKKVGGGANADAKGVGIEGGYDVSHDESMKVTKEKDGKLTYDSHEGDADKLSGGAKVSVGVVEGGAKFSHTNTTSTGYKVSIDPNGPKAAEMQGALARCKSQKDLDAFAARYPQSVQEKTKSKGTADTQAVSVGVGPVKVGLDYGNSLDEAVTLDKDGKFKKKVVTGGNTGGAELGVGKLKIGASTEEKAVAAVDADGNASLDLTKSDKSTDAAKWLEANVPLVGDKKDKKEGALTKAAGGAEAPDTDAKDLKGIHLKGSDLGYLGSLACGNWGQWMSACPSPGMRDDWAKAGHAIKRQGGDKGAVAQELARFIGGDSGSRADVINALVRPAGDVSSGFRYEFPGNLAAQKGAYDAVVVDDSEKQLDALKDDKAKLDAGAAALVGQLEQLYSMVASASGFSQPAVQAEMLAAISSRKDKVQTALRVLKGGKADELSKDDKLKKYNDYIDNCVRFQNTEKDCFAKIEATFKGGSQPNLDEAIDNAKLIKQVRDLHALWQPQYDEMAALAQENGFGKDNYWKFKPDRDRFDRAVKGNPGGASEAKPEAQDKRKKPPPKREPADPVGDANREMEKNRAATTAGIEARLPAAKNKAYAAGNRLFAWVRTDKRPAAGDAHNRGMALLKRADGSAAKVKKGSKEDLESYGFIAIEDYESATRTFGEGLALYPAGMPKQRAQET